jgi:hypothetical protein
MGITGFQRNTESRRSFAGMLRPAKKLQRRVRIALKAPQDEP